MYHRGLRQYCEPIMTNHELPGQPTAASCPLAPGHGSIHHVHMNTTNLVLDEQLRISTWMHPTSTVP
jgi:hypothetical protein